MQDCRGGGGGEVIANRRGKQSNFEKKQNECMQVDVVGLGLLADTQIGRQANWPTDFIRPMQKRQKSEQLIINSAIRSFGLIIFGRDNLFGLR